jgi:glycosyltransferase involved in cell wall biosynthesis
MIDLPYKLAFVIPWYGNPTGGAEVFCRGLARALAALGHDVTVLTTCCRDPFHDWSQNHLPAGETFDGPVRVLRFPVDGTDRTAFAHYYQLIDRGLDLSPTQEEEWMANSINSSALYRYIAAKRKKYFFFFLPYLYGTTFFGIRAAGRQHSFLIPCLHNEPFAYLAIMQEMFSRVRGCLFLSEPERDLANALFPIYEKENLVLGGGLDRECVGDAARFRAHYKITDPYALCVGRKVPGKGTDLLVSYFEAYRRYCSHDPLRLVLIGKGKVEVPPELKDFVLEPELDEWTHVFDAMAGCEFLIQPSFFESFSLVLMEAWLNGRPVLVNGECEVTLHHVLESNGGLYFTNVGEFIEIIRLLRARPELAATLGRAGEQYVRSRYLWPATAMRLHDFLERLWKKVRPSCSDRANEAAPPPE